MTPDGQRPTSYKIYYDILSYLLTQTAFCFTTAPFVLLGLRPSLLVWSRVYFYAVFGAAASVALFASPAKKWLVKKLAARSRVLAQQRSLPKDVDEHPLMGLPSDLGEELDDAVREFKDETKGGRVRSAGVGVPNEQGTRARAVVKDKFIR